MNYQLYKTSYDYVCFHPDKYDTNIVHHFNGNQWQKMELEEARKLYKGFLESGYTTDRPEPKYNNIVVDML